MAEGAEVTVSIHPTEIVVHIKVNACEVVELVYAVVIISCNALMCLLILG